MGQDTDEQNRLCAELGRIVSEAEAEAQCRSGPDGTAQAVGFYRALSGVAAQLDRLFELPCPDAPGLSLVAARVNPKAFLSGATAPAASATGKGQTLRAALLSCLGEAIEYLSQQVWGDEAITRLLGPPPCSIPNVERCSALLDLAGYDGFPPSSAIGWVAGRRLLDGAESWLPAPLCYRGLVPGAYPEPRIKLGSGCAVGPTLEAALLHALLELIERDAVALWWLGGRCAAPVRVQIQEAAGVETLMIQLRGGRRGRRSWLLDITTDLGVPCVAAISCDRDGRGLACGFSAHLNAAAAVRSAILEMCQTEIAIHVVQLKRVQQGDKALNAADLQHLKRCYDLDVTNSPLLHPNTGIDHPRRSALLEMALHDQTDFAGAAATLSRHLYEFDVEVYALEITRRQLAVPAVRLLAPDLQPLPSIIITPRLASQIEATGGGQGLSGGVTLI